MDLARGLAEALDALDTKGHEPPGCAAAVERHPRLWLAHEAGPEVTTGFRIHADRISCDVLVIGGGAAGVAAAAAAGRAGARVVLLERYGFLGGLATTAQVGTVCGLYLRDTESTKPTPVAGGFVSEYAARPAAR